MKDMTLRNRWFLLIVLLAAASVATAAAGGFFANTVLNHPNRKYFLGSAPYLVYVISNIPERSVMRLVCRDALLRTVSKKNVCTYLPLASVGSYGRQQKDLLPFDPRKDAEMVVVIDRSTLTPAEKTNLATLIDKCYPLLPDAPERPQVTIWLQNSGDSGGEYQVLLDVPSVEWLEDITNELWALPDGTLRDKSFGKQLITHPVNTLAICSNDLAVRDALAQASGYSEIHLFGLAEAEEFLTLPGFTQRILAVNWNGDAECPPALAARLLPPALAGKAAELTPDTTGLTGWQRFCRQALARHDVLNAVDIWTLCAPTSRHLQSLAAKVVANRFSGGPYTLALGDLSQVRRLALGVSFAPSDYDEERFTVQKDLESLARKLLPASVQAVVLPQGWSPDPPKDAVVPQPDADAVLLFQVEKLSPLIKYDTLQRRLTPAYPQFTDLEPSRPSPPNPDERRRIHEQANFYPGKTATERQNSKEYQADYTRWKDHDQTRWEKEHADWEARVKELEEKQPDSKKLASLKKDEPQKPTPPDPDRLKTISRDIYIFPGGNSYEREHSAAYRSDYQRWEHADYASYLRDYHDWQYRRENWLNDRETYPVNYEYSVASTPQVSLTGALQMLDLRGEPRQLWTATVNRAQIGQGTVMGTFPQTVYGELATPARPHAIDDYVDTTTWRDVSTRREADSLYGLGQELLRAAVERGVVQLAEEAIWAEDVKAWNQPTGR
ncbi:MAG TPA: hypothetical protein VGM23_08535 [Armatimonadota bacterium]